jgi:hypothetical protein
MDAEDRDILDAEWPGCHPATGWLSAELSMPPWFQLLRARADAERRGDLAAALHAYREYTATMDRLAHPLRRAAFFDRADHGSENGMPD